uniref:Uncharacterized protein n=1 Tax=Kalanchoe fedtschenkoi TaxID=63787 RepID=A0A7N0UYD9_KALFE
MRTSDRYVFHLHEWFVKLSRPLMRLASLIPARNGSAPLSNPNPIDLPQGLNYPTLVAIIFWCEHNRYSPLDGEEWRRWEFGFYRKLEAIIGDIDAGIKSLEIREMRLSLDQHTARVAGEDFPAPVKRRLEVEALTVRMSCGRKRSRRCYCSPGPSKLRNMMMSVEHHNPAEA